MSARRAERRVAWLTLIGCAGAAVLAFASVRGADPAAIAGGVAAALVAAAIAYVGLWRAGWIGGGKRIRHLAWSSEGGWLLTDASGCRWSGRLRGQTRVAGRWLWLSWRLDGRRVRSLLVAPGDMGAQDLRRLVVRLRIEGVALHLTAVPAT